jgi:photosystem II stability/assembly factor-like uncharacterized protein
MLHRHPRVSAARAVGRDKRRLASVVLVMSMIALTLGIGSLSAHRGPDFRPDLASATSVRVTTGSAYTSSGGNLWGAASGFSAGNTYSVTHAVTATQDEALYQTERWGNSFNYQAAVANGQYIVTLKFAELYWSEPGQRVFNVAINNVPVLTNFDILAHTAPFRALDKSFPITVTGGIVTISFSTVRDNAKVDALAILPVTSPPPTTTTTVRPPTTTTTAAPPTTTTTLPAVNMLPAPGSWSNVTSNLANMASECGNLTMISAVPGSNTIIAGIAQEGLWASTNNGASWTHLGSGSGSSVITNRPQSITYDPAHPGVFWEAGIYNGGGVYKTTDGGLTFQQLGNVTHNESVSVDFSDPNRQTILAGGHERSQYVWKSTDGGQTWSNIGLNLPAGTGFSESPIIINSQTYIVNTDTSWGGGSPGMYRTTDGGASWTLVSTQGPGGHPLVTATGTILFPFNNNLLRSSDAGVTWAQVGSNLQNGVHPIQLPDGRLVDASGDSLAVSSDSGVTWTPFGAALPFSPGSEGPSIAYMPNSNAFMVSQSDCGNVVLPNAIAMLK